MRTAVLGPRDEEVVEALDAREERGGPFRLIDGEVGQVEDVVDELGCDGIDERAGCGCPGGVGEDLLPEGGFGANVGCDIADALVGFVTLLEEVLCALTQMSA